MSNSIFFLTNPLLNLAEKKLDVDSLRNGVISNNVANVNTPGYKKSVVKFEEILKEQMQNIEADVAITDARHILPKAQQVAEPQVLQDDTTSMRQDGNNVDIDSEMSQLAMNTIDYDSSVQILNSRLSTLKYIINDGRK